ncbi:hypothetical protein HY837_06575 [archaeon]|nr:hypothetical protein [archaeon]
MVDGYYIKNLKNFSQKNNNIIYFKGECFPDEYSSLKEEKIKGGKRRNFDGDLIDMVNDSFIGLPVKKGEVIILPDDASSSVLQLSTLLGPSNPKPPTPNFKPQTTYQPPKPKKRHNPEITDEDRKAAQTPKRHNPAITEEDRKQFEAQKNENNQGQNNQA